MIKVEDTSLTEDILLKYGFTKHGTKYTLNDFIIYDFEYHANGNDFKGWIVPLTDGDFFMSGKFLEIKYLHELQNTYLRINKRRTKCKIMKEIIKTIVVTLWVVAGIFLCGYLLYKLAKLIILI